MLKFFLGQLMVEQGIGKDVEEAKRLVEVNYMLTTTSDDTLKGMINLYKWELARRRKKRDGIV
jgi:hypothetical protein